MTWCRLIVTDGSKGPASSIFGIVQDAKAASNFR